MSVQLINQYYTKREKLIQLGGSKNELSIRDAFKHPLNHFTEKKNLLASMQLNFQPKADSPPAEIRPIFQVVYTFTDFKQKISSALKIILMK
jgi:hypothetical protein